MKLDLFKKKSKPKKVKNNKPESPEKSKEGGNEDEANLNQ
jgi:hypothetical protein